LTPRFAPLRTASSPRAQKRDPAGYAKNSFLAPKKARCSTALNSRNHAANSKKGNVMSKPSHIAYVVNKKKDAKPGDKGFWRPVGAVWPHEKGNGFDVVIHDQLSVGGRIVCTEPKDNEPETHE
jgi:hypothetical protein